MQHPQHHPVRLVAIAVSAIIALSPFGAPTPARATDPSYGLSGIFDIDHTAWSGLDGHARLAFIAERAKLGVTLGAGVLRFGVKAPDIFSESALQGTFPWMFADRVVRVLGQLDVDVLVTLKQLATASQRLAYRRHLTRLFERYDGDTNFAVEGAAVQFDYPDIDDSGTVTFLDWDASPNAKQAWADAHRLRAFEIGDRLRAAEDGAGFAATDYIGMVTAAQQAAATADGVSLALGGTDLDGDSRNRFLDRIEGVDGDGVASAGAHMLARAGALDGGTALATLDNFAGWMRDAGLGETAMWLTEISVAAAPAGPGPGPCLDLRCSERTQVHGLVRLVMSASSRGYARILYSGVVELEGSETTVGLATAPAEAALSLRVEDLQPRPAYAVWRLLPEITAGGAVTRLGALPTNAFGVEVATGWVLWSDWALEVGPGQPYDGLRRKEVVLRGLTTPAVRVTSLWPTTVGDTVGTDGAVAATWSEQVIPVRVDGTVVVAIDQDPVWVTPVATHGAEQPADVSEAPTDDVAAAEPDAPPRSSGGCAATPAPAPLSLALVFVLGWLTWRRRSASGNALTEGRGPVAGVDLTLSNETTETQRHGGVRAVQSTRLRP